MDAVIFGEKSTDLDRKASKTHWHITVGGPDGKQSQEMVKRQLTEGHFTRVIHST